MNNIFILASILAGVSLAENKTIFMGVGKTCPSDILKVDHFEDSLIKHVPLENKDYQLMRRDQECSVAVITGKADHGLCLSISEINLSCEVELFFYINAYEPDKKFDCRHARSGDWCTVNPMMTVTLNIRRPHEFTLNGPFYNFSITAEAVPVDHIRKVYYLDSEVTCGIEHILGEDDSVRMISHRRPRVTKALPEVCEMTFITEDPAEYQQVCIRFDKFPTNEDCELEIVVKDLMAPYWNQNETFNCVTSPPDTQKEYCSSNKQLSIRLHRKSATNADFAITALSKRHPFWDVEEQIKGELIGLAIVRGIIVIVSVVNTVVALGVSLVAFLDRNPLSTFRQWGLHSILYIPSREATVVLTMPNTYEGSTPPEKIESTQPVI